MHFSSNVWDSLFFLPCLHVILLSVVFSFNIYLFICETEREREWGEGQREMERISSSLSIQHRAPVGARSQDNEIITWAEIKGQTLKQLSHPSTHPGFLPLPKWQTKNTVFCCNFNLNLIENIQKIWTVYNKRNWHETIIKIARSTFFTKKINAYLFEEALYLLNSFCPLQNIIS